MDFRELVPSVRTVALVGEFLQRWALMESEMNRVIGKALGLNQLQTLIVCRNAQFTAKTHILKTAINYTMLGASSRERYSKIIDAIGAASPTRNMLAHDVFLTSDNTDGVVFHAIKARGELKFPDEDWSVEKFEEWFTKLANWYEEISALGKELAPDTKSLGQLLVDLAQNPPSPPPAGGGLFGLGAALPETLQSQGILGPFPGEPKAPEESKESQNN